MSDKMFSVAGQVVIVAGGSRGIGRAIAHGFVERGATVIISGRPAYQASLGGMANRFSIRLFHPLTPIEPSR